MLVRQLEIRVRIQLAYRMPEIEHAVRAAAEKAGPVHYVSFPLDQRLKQAGIIGGVVFQIRILDDDEISARLLDAATQCRAFALIFREEKIYGVVNILLSSSDKISREPSVEPSSTQITSVSNGTCYTRNYLPQSAALVINGNDDRQFHGTFGQSKARCAVCLICSCHMLSEGGRK